jgi:hypothetical protein
MLMIIISGMFLTSCGSNNTKEIPLRSGKYGYLLILVSQRAEMWLSLEQVGNFIKGIEFITSADNFTPKSLPAPDEDKYFVWGCNVHGVRNNNVIKITNLNSFRSTPDACNLSPFIMPGSSFIVHNYGIPFLAGSKTAVFKNANINQFKDATINSLRYLCNYMHKYMIQNPQIIYAETIACSNQLKIPSS